MNKFKLCLFALSALFWANAYGFDKSEYFDSYIDLESYFFENSDTGASELWDGLTMSYDEDTKLWTIDISCMCSTFWSSAVLYDWDNQKILKVKGMIAGIKHPRYDSTPDDEPWDKPGIIAKEAYKKSNAAIRGIIKKMTMNDFNNTYKVALKKYKEGNKIKSGGKSKAILEYEYFQIVYPIQKSNVARYNDFGFFLEQAKLYEQAIKLLNKVVSSFPNRTVAYVNLGDAYFGTKDMMNSKKAYNKYVELMLNSGKGSRIPSYVYDRLK